MNIGDVITLKAGCTYASGKSIPDWVFNKTLYYRGLADNGVDIVFSTLNTGPITGVVKAENVVELNKSTKDYSAIGKKVYACLNKIKTLDEFKELEKLL